MTIADLAELRYRQRLAADFPGWMPPISPEPTRRAVPTVYLLYAADDALLYIGATHILSHRLKGHRSLAPWWGRVARAEIHEMQTWMDAIALETRLINEMAPVGNIRRKGWKHGC